MRDNMIRAGSKIDVHEFCADMLGAVFGTGDSSRSSGLRIWGDSWLIESWEMTEGFIGKWGWLLEGCGEFVRATNGWRQRRGEVEFLVQFSSKLASV